MAFATATEWVARLSEAQRAGRLAEEITRLGRIPLLVTSNKPFSGWGEIFGDEVVAAAMIDRLVHHAEILNLKGDSYRLRDKDVATRPRPALIDES